MPSASVISFLSEPKQIAGGSIAPLFIGKSRSPLEPFMAVSMCSKSAAWRPLPLPVSTSASVSKYGEALRKSPYIAVLNSIWEQGNNVFFSHEQLFPCSLKDAMSAYCKSQQVTHLSVDAVTRITAMVVHALMALHEKEFVHGAVTDYNILLSSADLESYYLRAHLITLPLSWHGSKYTTGNFPDDCEASFRAPECEVNKKQFLSTSTIDVDTSTDATDTIHSQPSETEQITIPRFSNDIYSLGALLQKMMNLRNEDASGNSSSEHKSELDSKGEAYELLTNLMKDCLQADAAQRPTATGVFAQLHLIRVKANLSQLDLIGNQQSLWNIPRSGTPPFQTTTLHSIPHIAEIPTMRRSSHPPAVPTKSIADHSVEAELTIGIALAASTVVLNPTATRMNSPKRINAVGDSSNANSQYSAIEGSHDVSDVIQQHKDGGVEPVQRNGTKSESGQRTTFMKNQWQANMTAVIGATVVVIIAAGVTLFTTWR